MKKYLSRIISFFIHKAKQSKYIQQLFEAPLQTSSLPVMGSFVDSQKNTHILYDGLRSKIKPGWEKIFSQKKVNYSSEIISTFISNGEIAAEKLILLCEASGKLISESDIFEVGCHSGATSFSLAERGAKSVTGTEFSGYKVKAVSQHNTDESALCEVNDDLKILRERIASSFSRSVSFRDDDICNSHFPKESFDIICSWDVLEHLHNPQQAFDNCAKLLRSGGIMIHEYNPFFGLNGGHSYCTLDFLWGHVRLNNQDFERYISEIRFEEKEMDISFYNQGINRMSIQDMRTGVTNAGLKICSVLPYIKEQHVQMMTSDIVRQAQQVYPHISIEDLVAPRVIVIAQKE
ncbi:MAG: class I SAM-dependent methyltransferase [Bacteroidales bacterium]|jgi:2-polyprenyl-3-methyl-5-hydroxy-6-metoxy-1,4-benzoquinol methylase|nr:class I SAM-dependent methyltransferase [Bacteroidales bacterium]